MRHTAYTLALARKNGRKGTYPLRDTPPPRPNPDQLVCHTHKGAKLVRDGETFTFIPGEVVTYIESREDLMHPGAYGKGYKGGHMPSPVRATNYAAPVPNQQPTVTRRKGTKLMGWEGRVAVASGDVRGRAAVRSSEVRPPIVRSFTGAKLEGDAARKADKTADTLRANVQLNWDRTQASYKGAIRS